MTSSIKKISVMPSTKGRTDEEIHNIIKWLKLHKYQIMIPENKGSHIGLKNLEKPIELIKKSSDLMISLGGDGTLLEACNIIAGAKIPILGINLGHLGFLTEISFCDWETALKKTLTGEYEIQKRMMLSCKLVRSGSTIFDKVALNDVVVSHGGKMVLLKFSLKINGHYTGTYAADGVIISTPTGSTAYSLSAGGPIVNPNIECLILTAICPHTLTARPLVIPAEEKIEIKENSGRNYVVSLDGRNPQKVKPMDTIIVNKSNSYAHFVHLGKKFYTTIREKLKWFER